MICCLYLLSGIPVKVKGHPLLICSLTEIKYWTTGYDEITGISGAARSCCFERRRAGPAREPGYVQQRCCPHPVSALRCLPSPEGHRTYVADDVQRDAAMGGAPQASGCQADNASVARRSAHSRFSE